MSVPRESLEALTAGLTTVAGQDAINGALESDWITIVRSYPTMPTSSNPPNVVVAALVARSSTLRARMSHETLTAFDAAIREASAIMRHVPHPAMSFLASRVCTNE